MQYVIFIIILLILVTISIYSTALLGAIILIALIVRSSYKTYKSNHIDKREIGGMQSTLGRYWSSTLYFASGYIIALRMAGLVPIETMTLLAATILCALFTEVAALNDSKIDKR